jgi:hypothetical protein
MELKRAFDYARDDPEVGVVIFTGKVLAKSCSSFPILRLCCSPRHSLEQKHFVVGEIKQCEESMVMLAVITLVG